MSEPTPTVEERLAALESWKAATVDPALGQAQQALTRQGQRIGALEDAGAKLDARLTKVVNLLKRIGPSIKDIIGIVATEAANKEARLPEDIRTERAKRREEVLNGDFSINGTDK
jgi:hypothetical protein